MGYVGCNPFNGHDRVALHIYLAIYIYILQYIYIYTVHISLLYHYPRRCVKVGINSNCHKFLSSMFGFTYEWYCNVIHVNCSIVLPICVFHLQFDTFITCIIYVSMMVNMYTSSYGHLWVITGSQWDYRGLYIP